jgi:hypothetical protein
VATPRSSAAGFQTLGGWILRIARLDFSVFDDARKERTGTAGAVLIVLSASIVAGIGTVIWAMQHDYEGLNPAPIFLKACIAGGLLQTAVWLLWVYMTQWVLIRLGAQVVFQELIRTMGVAFAPMYLSIFVGVAPLAVPFGIFSLGLTVLFSNIAIEQTTGVTPREATFANLAGFGAFLVFMGAFANVAEAGTFGGLAPGILFFSLDL